MPDDKRGGRPRGGNLGRGSAVAAEAEFMALKIIRRVLCYGACPAVPLAWGARRG
jgi:hypothetical protein